jgi:hypothetical protein
MLYNEGIAHKVTVQIVGRHNDLLEISSSGLKGGEQLIYAGQTNLEDGNPVEVVTQ